MTADEPSGPKPARPARPLAVPRRMAEAPRPRKSINFWIFMFLAGGTVVGLGVLAFMVLFAKAANEDAVREAEWRTQTVEKGWFTVEFPGALAFEQQPVEGREGKLNMCAARIGDSGFELTWLDLGIGPVEELEFDFAARIADMARDTPGYVGTITDRNLERHRGQRVRFDLENNRQSHVWLLRRGNRVYMLAAKNLTREDADIADRYFDSLKLEPPVYDPEDPALPQPPRLAMPADEKLIFHRGQSQAAQLSFTLGTPPYIAEVPAASMPGGLEGSVVGSRLVLRGAPTETGNFSLLYRVTDATGYVTEGKLRFTVKPHPFTINCVGITTTGREAGVTVGQQIDASFVIEGDAHFDDVHWTATGMPRGLLFKSGDGPPVLAGACAEAGTFTIEIKATVRKLEDGSSHDCVYHLLLKVTDKAG